MQLKWLIFFLFFQYKEIQATGKLSATGGGVVTDGQDLVLKYETDEDWTANGGQCYWYRYEPKEDGTGDVDAEYCRYEMVNGNVTQDRCSPEGLGNHLEYTGITTEECTITVKSVTMKDDCKWATRSGSDINTLEIDIVVAVEVESITIEAPDYFTAGHPSNVTCVVEGGKPKPQISLRVSPPDSIGDDIPPENIKEEYNETLNLRKLTTTITPEIDDHGKKIQCSEEQFDKAVEPQLLFDGKSAEVTLKVTFAPQPMPDTTLTATVGEDVLIRIEFFANPTPSKIEWLVETPSKTTEAGDNANGTSEVITLLPGNNTEKYVVANLVELDDQDLKFRADLTIKDVTEDDFEKNYHLSVTNAVGYEEYAFSLTTEKEEEKEEAEEPESDNVTMYVLIGVAIVLVLVVLAIFIYKKSLITRHETDPLLRRGQ